MKKPKVGIIIGSQTDLPKIEKTCSLLKEFGIDYELSVNSAHRNPAKVKKIVEDWEKKFDLIIAGAGMSAALPGVVASHTILPVIGIPFSSPSLSGHDALFSVVQMPSGVPVASVAIDGSKNAAILACQILALKYPALVKKLKALKNKLKKS